jgi:hypothetical protein
MHWYGIPEGDEYDIENPEGHPGREPGAVDRAPSD